MVDLDGPQIKKSLREVPAATPEGPAPQGPPQSSQGNHESDRGSTAGEPSKSCHPGQVRLSCVSFPLISSSSAEPGSRTRASRVLTVDIHGPADVCAAQRVGDLAGDGLEEERVVHDGFVEVTGGFLYNLAFFRPPVEENRASWGCCLVSLAISTCGWHSAGGSTPRVPLASEGT